ncbi:MAG: hypothetical protein EBS55_13490 [Flavobacteriaceae bacterium]|nr:hypothetical protein [Flavobacteriaceae bacterium]
MKDNKISANVKIDKDFLNKIAFDCNECGARAEFLDREHPDFYDFCKSQNRDPEEMLMGFRKSCDNSCNGELKMIELTTFDSFSFAPKPSQTETYSQYKLIKD